MNLKTIFSTEKMFRCILFAGIPALLFYGFSLVGLRATGFDVIEILRDPAHQSGQSTFLGFLSNIAVWLWVSSATICFFCAMTGDLVNKGSHRELLFLVGILSMILAIDDFFLIQHRYVNQKLCYLFYAIFSGTLLVRHYKKIMEIDGFSFLLACLLFVLSILTDAVQTRTPLPSSYVQVFEESFKFIGIATWLYFICRIASFRPAPSTA